MDSYLFLKVSFLLMILTTNVNCRGNETSNSNCSSIPRLTVEMGLGGSRTEGNESMENVTDFVDRGYQVFYIKKVLNIILTCSAKNPVHIDILRQMPQPIEKVNFQRKVEDFWNKSTYCYQVKLQFKTFHTTTGKYICREIIENNPPSTIYILANGNSKNGVMLNSGEEITYAKFPNDLGWIEIPCIITDPRVVPELSRVRSVPDNTLEKIQPDSPGIKYEPTVGFLINATSFGGTETTFTCKHEANQRTFRVENAGPTKAFVRVFPPSEEMYESQATLICESNKEIYSGWINEGTAKLNVQYEVINSFFKFRVTTKVINMGVDSNANKRITIECHLNATSRLLHVWKFEETKSNTRVGIAFSKLATSSRFICYTRNGTIPSIQFIECDNPINCQIARNFSYLAKTAIASLDGPFPFINKQGYTCTKSQEAIYGALGLVCALIPNDELKQYGLIKCRESDSESGQEAGTFYSTFVNAFTEQIVNHLEQPTLIRSSDILQITKSTGKQTIAVNELVTFECKASAFIFATGLQFQLVLTNGTIIASDSPSNQLWNTYEMEKSGIISLNLTTTLETTQFSKIFCFAPYWNTAGWANVSEDLLVAYIQFASPLTELFFLNEIFKSIQCEDWDVPEQEVKWSKDGRELTSGDPILNVSLVFLNNRSTVIFPEVREFHSGLYVCQVTNSEGLIRRKKIDVKIQEASSGFIILYIITIACGTIAILIIIFVFLRILKKQRTTIAELTEAEIHEFHYGNEDLAKRYVELHENARYLPYQQEFEIPKHKLEVSNEDLLGAGTFGVVSKGYLLRNGVKVPVAVKTARSNSDITYLKILLSEIKIMMFIGNHPNIITLLGATTKDLKEGKLQVVIEFCFYGCLQDFLRKSRETFINQVVQDEIDCRIVTRRQSSPLGHHESSKLVNSLVVDHKKSKASNSTKLATIRTSDLVRWAHQTANGMEYLGQKKVIHGDLAVRNLLLDSKMSIKITDFGLSRHLYEYTNYIKKSKEEPVPWRWLSTEAFRDSKFSAETDVWAYGITLWEMFALGEVPYQGFSWGEEFVNRLYEGYRLPRPQYSPINIYNLMQECWLPEPCQRPTFTKLKDTFQHILALQKRSEDTRTKSAYL